MKVLLLLLFLTTALAKPLIGCVTGRDISVYSLSATAEYQAFANRNPFFNVTILPTNPANEANVTATYDILGNEDAAIVLQVLTPISSNWLQAAANYTETVWANEQQTPSFTNISANNTQWAPRSSWYAALVKGFVAGIMSNSSQLGMVIPFDLAPFVADTNAYYIGALLANPNSSLTIYVVGTYFSTEIDAAVEALFAAQPTIDVMSHQMGTLDVQEYVFNTTTDVYMVEDILSLHMSTENVLSVIGNPRVLTAISQNLVPLFEYWAYSYLAGDLIPDGLIVTNEIDGEVIYDNTPLSPLVPTDKAHAIKKVHKKYVDKGKNPFCGDIAIQQLGPVYQLVNGCQSEYDVLTGTKFAVGIDVIYG
jgi:hypothetical protein